MTHDDDAIARRAREVFEAASANVDPTTGGRLRLARRAALAGPARPPRKGLLVFAGAGAGALAVAMAAWLAWPRAQAPGPAPIAATPTTPAPVAVEAPDGPAVVPDVEVDVPPPIEAMPDLDVADDEATWAALDDEDAELYAWLADAPVAPEDGEEAL